MANVDPPAISTPSRPRYSLNRMQSGTFTAASNTPNVAGFSPGGQVFEGYSYLSRSTSMSTSTRSRPKGLQSRTSDISTTPPAPTRNLPTSPTSPRHPRTSNSTTNSPFTHSLDLPQRSNTISYRMPSSISTPELQTLSIHPARSESESERLAEAVANLPHNPKIWLPSQVALYLTHVLGLVPRPVVEDVTAYVRSSRMGGRAFLRLSEKDLERQGLNLKWRKLMIEAVRKLRRDALRGRIWGYESGSLRWPKSAQDLERQEADEDASQEEDQTDGVIRNSKATSKLTLKRMRDSRKVRGMIEAFQTSPEKEDVALPSLPTDAVFGDGYVRDQAQQILSEAEQQKKLSLRRPLRPRRSTADFPWLDSQAEAKKEDVEALLASLTEQEANDLANELGLSDLHDTDAVGRALQHGHADDKKDFTHHHDVSSESADEAALMPTLTRHGSADSTSLSETSGTESEADSSSDLEYKPRYGVLDEDIIRAILAEEDSSAPTRHEEESSPKARLSRSHTTASIVRPERPYRASLYTDDELEALNTAESHTRTESSRELVEALMSSEVAETVEPGFGTARLRSAEEKHLAIPPIPTFEAQTNTSEAEREDEYIFHLPEQSARKPASQAGSIRLGARKATFGSKRGKAVLSMLNKGADAENSDLFASLPGATMLRQKSSDEEGWGGTLGRRSSRKSLNSVFEGGMFGSPAPSAFRKRGLERVASEAEGEAFHAKLDLAERTQQLESTEEVAEAPAERYEETESEEAMHHRPSLEHRLSSLFDKGERAQESATSEEADSGVSTIDVTEESIVEAENASPKVVSESSDADGAPEVMVEEPVLSEPLSNGSEDTPRSPVEPASGSVSDVPSGSITEEAVEELMEGTAESVGAAEALPTLSEEEPHGQGAVEIVSADPTAAATSETSEEEPFEFVPSAASLPTDSENHLPGTEIETNAEPQMLVPLTVLEPHSSGTGSIKKRSMVLVDRRRFESLARRMSELETQLDRVAATSPSTAPASVGLRDMFSHPESAEADAVPEGSEADEILDAVLAAATAQVPEPVDAPQKEAGETAETTAKSRGGWWKPSSWAGYLSSLNPYYAEPNAGEGETKQARDEEDELSLYALLGRPESEQEKHLLSIGAIPAYMLGLGAGVGFVLVREVLGKGLARQ